MEKCLCSIFLSVLTGLGLQARAPSVDDDKLLSLIVSNSFIEADRLASSLLKNPSINPDILAVCGLAVLKAGRIDEAEILLKKAVALAPANPEAHLGLGRLARIRNDNAAAIPHLEKALFSAGLREEALRQLWRAVRERGRIDELRRIRSLAAKRYQQEGQTPPAWLDDAIAQIRDRDGKVLCRMTGRFDQLSLPLILRDNNARFGIRMVALKINGRGEYPFDIDSALADALSLSPPLAEELGLSLTGSGTGTGVGTREIRVRSAVLDKVEIGPVTLHDVPVQVSDARSFRGEKKGLLGTGFLKRFNVTIDPGKEAMILYPLERPDLLAAGIDRKSVAADIPLYLFDQTVVGASVGGGPEALYILDSAAATNLADKTFFDLFIRPKIDPARIVPGGIQGAGGAQQTFRVDGLPVVLGQISFPGLTFHEYSMEMLNVIAGRFAAGLLGNPLLWPYRVHMNFRDGRLILEKR